MKNVNMKDYLENDPLIIPITNSIIIKVNNLFYTDDNPENISIEYELLGITAGITDEDIKEAKELFEKSFQERLQKSISKYIK